jgi:lysophospholipase L1-like esterase
LEGPLRSGRKAHVLRAVVWTAAFLVLLFALEGLARIVWESKYHDLLEATLHGYEHVDRARNLVVPRPGAQVTGGEFRSDLTKRGRSLGIACLEDFLREHDLPDTAVFIRINQHGFRGPDIAVPKPDGVFRILTIGGSCTWGQSVSERCAYPRVLERTLNRLTGGRGGSRVEVVNGGFCADGLRRSLGRVEEFAGTEPDLVTIYQGWNRTIFRADPRKNRSLYRLLALYRFYYHTAVDRPRRGLESSRNRVPCYDPHDPSLEPFREYGFEKDILDLDRLVRELRHRVPATIVLVTLAGLLDCEVQPDDRSLEISYPLSQSENVYLYALLTERWNEAVRRYALEHNLHVIDLEKYARDHLARRSDYFLDNVHWNARGYDEVGRFLARGLLRYIPGMPVRSGDRSSRDTTRVRCSRDTTGFKRSFDTFVALADSTVGE